MCRCTPNMKTLWCGKGDCKPTAAQEELIQKSMQETALRPKRRERVKFSDLTPEEMKEANEVSSLSRGMGNLRVTDTYCAPNDDVLEWEKKYWEEFFKESDIK